MVERVSATGRFVATGSPRRLLLASFTIAAILLGLVGMHALSAGADTHSSHASHSQMPSGLHAGTQMTPGSADSALCRIAVPERPLDTIKNGLALKTLPR